MTPLKFVNRSLYYALLFVFVLSLLFFFYDGYSRTREKIDNYHEEFKRFLFLLRNAEPSRYYAGKVERNTLLKISQNLQLEKINKVGNTYELVFSSVPADKLVELLYRLEKYGKIEEFSAVDNSGKGLFHLRIVLKVE